MKNPMLRFVLATTIVVAVATGCSSTEKAGGSDTTATDTEAVMTDTTATPAPVDTTRSDTTVKM